MAVHLLKCQLLIRFRLQNHLPDICLFRTLLEPSIDTIGRMLEVMVFHFLDGLWLNGSEELVKERIVLDDLSNGDDFD